MWYVCHFSLLFSLLTVPQQKVSSAMSSKMLIATGAVRRGTVSVYYNLFPWKLAT